MAATIRLIDRKESERVSASRGNWVGTLSLLADMCRFNTINMVKRAGSGHLGTSFSAMDLVVYLYCRRMNTLKVGLKNEERDIYFSSKGHDVPGLYSLLYSLGVVPEERLLKLRRAGGLDGHPDTKIPGIEANSGSLGMGISKGKGMAIAKRLKKMGGHVYVLTGDGELQEGQNFEALQSGAHHAISNLTVIVDNNRVQSDKAVEEILSLGDLEKKFASFGWAVFTVDGHDFAALEKTFLACDQETRRPKIIIANTIKGRGVSFMEHPTALKENKGYYRWHSGAPDDETFTKAADELENRIQSRAKELGLGPIALKIPPPIEETPKKVESLLGEPESAGDGKAFKTPSTMKASAEFVAEGFGEALVALAETRKDLIVLDADLSADCRIRNFELKYPERFLQSGIAEQDMVSTAGGLARMGFLPVVNSFGTFLAARANEQIYNNASENTKIIYACHFAGMIPAGPGKSHQSIRDISLFGALPNMQIVQAASREECRALVSYCVNEAKENCMIRLNIGPSPRSIAFSGALKFGVGSKLTEGKQALFFAYGPVMLHEALTAAELLAQKQIGITVVNMPWLNRVDQDWLKSLAKDFSHIFVLDDHSPVGGLGDALLNALAEISWIGPGKSFKKFAVSGYPACGTPSEALRAHGLDGESLSRSIEEALVN